MTVKMLSALLMAVLVAACDSKTAQKATGATPTAVSAAGAPSAVCVTAMPTSLGVDASGPHLLFTAVAGNLTLEEQENGVWAYLDAKLTMRPGNVIDYHVHYDHSYRIAVTQAGCMQSPWLLMQTGPPNPNGSGETPPVPTPPTPPFHATRCTSEVFTNGDGNIVTLTFGDVGTSRLFTVSVTTKDPNHKAGYQPEQTREILIAQVDGAVFETRDVPEALKEVETSVSVRLGGPVTVTLRHANLGTGPQSVHGACVTLQSQ